MIGVNMKKSKTKKETPVEPAAENRRSEQQTVGASAIQLIDNRRNSGTHSRLNETAQLSPVAQLGLLDPPGQKPNFGQKPRDDTRAVHEWDKVRAAAHSNEAEKVKHQRDMASADKRMGERAAASKAAEDAKLKPVADEHAKKLAEYKKKEEEKKAAEKSKLSLGEMLGAGLITMDQFNEMVGKH
ncbi:MAG: hypothetical protein MI746_08845 [Pseudomonadales bacterium]|nr:hypothetical protein [Pseudomonadales bacterium]